MNLEEKHINESLLNVIYCSSAYLQGRLSKGALIISLEVALEDLERLKR